MAYFAWVILLEFVNNNVAGAQHFTSLAVRASWLGVAQVPLLILLAGKNNLIGALSGVSYERLNVLHRWVSRVLLFLITLHLIFLHLSWNAYDLGPLEYATDSCIPTGWATYAILLWINISTIAPIRNFSYEFFVVQHIVTFFGFIIAIMWHLPSTALYSRVYIYIPIALYIIDRIVRSARYAWNNIRPGRATVISLDGGVTRVTVSSNAIKSWTPGAHVFLSIPKFGIGQSHPATIASTPTSHNGKLVFILKAHKGFTSRLLQSANSATSLLPTKASNTARTQTSHIALIDGPYGGSYNDFASFDTVLLVAGSTGTTFTLPILLNIACRVHKQKLPVKRIVFLWIIKNTSWTSWISAELTKAAATLQAAGVELSIQIHVTCDDAFTTGEEQEVECDCACDKSAGPCCCISVEDSDDDEIQTVANEKGTSTSSSLPPERSLTRVNVQSRSNSPSSTSSTSLSSTKAGTKSRVLPCARFHSGRPDFYELLWELLEKAEGETGVACCGSLGLNSDVRRTVVRCSDERAVHKGTGAQGIYLHAECFGW